MAPITLPILHFNDVYNMASTTDTKVMRDGELTRTNFDLVVQFSEKITQIRNTWVTDVEPKGLVLFSGDLFSPSVESILTTGRNMVHLMNELAPDACVPGNHEFDYGRERFNQLVEFCNFDWILSNVKEYPRDKATKQVDFSGPGRLLLREYSVCKRNGLVIGMIGLMSDDAMEGTLAAAKANLKAHNMAETCKRLSSHLRKPKDQGGEGCDIVIALTHAEHTEDVELAKAVNAYPNTKKDGLENLDGVDAIFGGHNHNYALGQGVELTNESDTVTRGDTMTGDDGLLIVKSGYDFKDLSHVTLELEHKPNGTHRKYVITSLKVERHHMAAGDISAADVKKSPMERVLRRQFQNEVMRSLDTPVVKLPSRFVFDSKGVRKGETAIGNWITDTVLKAYKELGMVGGSPPLDPTMFIITGGSIRSNSLPEICRRRDIVALLPFPSTLVTMKLKGQAIKAALKGALSHQDIIGSGQFPVFSGIQVKWDSTTAPESRDPEVLVPLEEGDGWEPIKVDDEYCVLTNDYLAEGNIGFGSFKHPLQRFDSDLPVFQVLLSYLETMYALEHLVEGGTDKIAAQSNGIEDFGDLLAKISESIEPLLQLDETAGKKQEQDELRHFVKRMASIVYGNSPDAFIPPLVIKNGVDGRMVDVSK